MRLACKRKPVRWRLSAEPVFTHFRAILKVPALAGIVILASGRPAPVLLRPRPPNTACPPLRPALCGFFLFRAFLTFRFSLSLARPPQIARLRPAIFLRHFPPGFAEPDPERLQRLVTFPPAVRPPTVFLSCFSDVVVPVPALTAHLFQSLFGAFPSPFFPGRSPCP